MTPVLSRRDHRVTAAECVSDVALLQRVDERDFQAGILERLSEGLLSRVPPGSIIVPGSLRYETSEDRSNSSTIFKMTGLTTPGPAIVPPEAIDSPVDGTAFLDDAYLVYEVPTSAQIGTGSSAAAAQLQAAYGVPALIDTQRRFGRVLREAAMTMQGSCFGGALGSFGVGLGSSEAFDPEAEARAKALLKRLVTEEEYKRFEEKGCVLIKSGRGWYLIGGGYNTTIKCYPDFNTKKLRRYCLNIAEYGYVPTDLLIARLLMIRNFEDEFLSTAHEQTYYRHRSHRRHAVRNFLGMDTEWGDNCDPTRFSLKEVLKTSSPLYAAS